MWDETTILCPDDGEVVTANRATAKDGHSGGGGTGKGGGTGTGDTGTTEESQSDALFTLGPGCSIPLTVTATGAYVGDLWGSLVVESVQAEQTAEQVVNNDLPAFLRDPVRFRQIVYLHAVGPTVAGSVDSDPVVIGYPRPSQSACLEGESLSIETRVVDVDGQALAFTWSTDDTQGQALFDDPFAAVVTFTCPGLDAASDGRNVTVSTYIYDPDGHEVWSQEQIAVYPAEYALYDEFTEVREGG